MDIVITIPDDSAQTVIDCLCKAGDYKPTIVDKKTGEEHPNPVTPLQFAKERIHKHIRDVVRAQLQKEYTRPIIVKAMEDADIAVGRIRKRREEDGDLKESERATTSA